MSSKAITEKPDPQSPRGDWQPLQETAPSLVRVDEPVLGRYVGFIGLMFLALGGTALLIFLAGRGGLINPTVAAIFVIGGVACLLFHAACDGDVQVRRIYGLVGLLAIALAGILSAFPSIPVVGGFLPGGFVGLTLGLLFLLPFARHETDPQLRMAVLYALGGVGAVLALTGLVGGTISQWFLTPYGLMLAFLGLAYVWAFIGQEGTGSETAYQAGLALGLVGAVAFLVAAGRTILPPLFYSFRWLSARPDPYLVPSGLLLMSMGLLYLGFALAICSERRLVVMTRRELASFFSSPIAYLVLFGMTLIGWAMYLRFVLVMERMSRRFPEGLPEPIVSRYILDWVAVICVTFIVPVLTMRLFSEEKRTGTLEVLLTGPVDELSVVLSKFFAVFIFYMLLWLPWGLLLLGVRLEIGKPFEYHPLITFYLVMAVTGAGFLAGGLFFSSLTRNQVIAAVLTFALMLLYILAFLAKQQFLQPEPGQPEGFWATLATHISYIELWIHSFDGVLTPQYLVYHLSAAVFGLFLTVKVLEARKWW